MTASSGHTVTQLLLDWRQGDAAALDQLIPVVYQKLRRLARHYIAEQKVLKVSAITVMRDWQLAKVWLARALKKRDSQTRGTIATN
jgi:hypothetical protein